MPENFAIYYQAVVSIEFKQDKQM